MIFVNISSTKTKENFYFFRSCSYPNNEYNAGMKGDKIPSPTHTELKNLVKEDEDKNFSPNHKETIGDFEDLKKICESHSAQNNLIVKSISTENVCSG